MSPTPARQRLLLLGSGFASFSLLNVIDTRAWDVTVVSRRNHFLFTPLLPSTTVGTLGFRSIIEPVRQAREGATFYEAEATGVDLDRRSVSCRGADGAFELGYDTLVIGVGADVSTFGVPGVREHATFLKELSDARAIRQRVIACFERAAGPGLDQAERERLLHFVVVGGGPTGVEFAAEMHDFLREDLRRAYPELWRSVQITLLEAGPQLLTSFDAVLSAYTVRLFHRQRIDVRTGSPVVRLDDGVVELQNGERIGCGLVVWSAGVGPRPFIQTLAQTLSLAVDRSSRLLVDGFLRVGGREGLYAAGDCAVMTDLPLPMTAQVAQQQGRYLGKALNARAAGRSPRAFRYRHYGMLAYVGSNRALADLSSVKGRGFLTFLFWRSAYLTRLVSFKNKLLVIFDWFTTLVFGRDISRF